MAGPDILKLDESSDENINYPSERKSFGDFIRELLKTKVPDLRDDLELKNGDVIVNEFNEIQWDNIQVDSGLYLAEIKRDVGKSELVRLVVVK